MFKLFSDDSITFALIVITYLLLLITMAVLPIIRIRKRKRLLVSAFELLSKGLINNTLKETDEIVLVYKNNYLDISFCSFLEKYLLYILQKQTPEFYIDHSPFIKEMIRDEKSEKPFENIPDHEKRLLTAIEDAAQKEEVSSIPFNLSELARVLYSKEKNYRYTKLVNNFSIPLAIIGLILTLIFGFRSPSISQEDMNSIALKVKECTIKPDTTSITQP